ncbi:hypothetical protein D3C81_680150 [compost metagenome]
MIIDDHCQLAEQSTVAQTMLDLFGLDAKAADLHLIVATATQFDAISAPFADITGAVQTPADAVGQCQLQKTLVAQGGVVEIAQADAGAIDVQLTGLLLEDRLQVLVQDQHLGVGDGTPQVAGVIACLEDPGGRQHRGFGRPVDVVQLTLSGQLSDHRWFTDIATGDQVAQAQRLVEWQDAQQRGRQEGMADLLLADQRQQLLRVTSLVFAGDHQLGAANQRRQNIQQRSIEAYGRELQHPAVLVELNMRGIPGLEVAEVALAKQYALGLAGGARGIDRRAGGIHGRALAHQRRWEALQIDRQLMHVQRRQTGVISIELAIMQQRTGPGVAQNVPQTLRRLAWVQRQVHRGTAEYGEQAGVER